MIEVRHRKESESLNRFVLAFIEELTNGGVSFFHKPGSASDFIDSEYPFYSEAYKAEMRKIYKLYLNGNTVELERTAQAVSAALPADEARFIRKNQKFRFFVLKLFHDSVITDIAYNADGKDLQFTIDYDDAFCKIPFPQELRIVFKYVKADLMKILEPVNGADLHIADLDLFVRGEKMQFQIDANIYDENWTKVPIYFLCTDVTIY
ncbi:MAG: hypothetical protein LBL66_02505 [Clostridiales bacterium]|jgi:hypothetical protein|nr:hypothetical protein [Clostridiales bacterium]